MKKFSKFFWGTIGIVAAFGGFALMSFAPQIRMIASDFSCESTYGLFILEVIVGTIAGLISFVGTHTAIYQFTGVSLYREYVRYVEKSPKIKVGNK